MLKAVIIEDSRLARLELSEQLKAFPEVELLGEAENVEAGLELINDVKPNVLFLDIHMPQQTGFDLLEQLHFEPLVIFTTAYEEHALRSFDYETVDYLLKPIVASRLKQSIDRAVKRMQRNEPEQLGYDSQFYVKDGQKNWFIKLNQVSLFESIGNYTRIHFDNEKAMLYKSLTSIEKRLPNTHFFRANRHQLINLTCIDSIETNVGGSIELRLTSGEQVEVSRRQTSAFKNQWSL